MSHTAFVTGASRGLGRGIAIALADEGYQVFGTGRSIASADLPPSVTRIPCDHTHLHEVEAAFQKVDRLDVLVNAAWGGYETMVEDGKFTWNQPFWERPPHHWQRMMEAGVHAAWTASVFGARLMVPHRKGLIVNLSFWAAQKYVGNSLYGIAKAATDKMSHDCAQELRPHGIAVVSLYPGMARTESVLEAAQSFPLDLSNSESPEFSGRVVAALARDPELMDHSGQVVVTAQAALRYGIVDVDGKQPRPLTLESV